MTDTFLKDHVYMNIPKKYSHELEELIGDINNVLESKVGMRICYDKNDSHMDHSTKPEEDCFSGFAILRDDQNEADDIEIKIAWGSDRDENDIKEYSFKSENEYLAFLKGVDESNGWLDYSVIGNGCSFETIEEWKEYYHGGTQ